MPSSLRYMTGYSNDCPSLAFEHSITTWIIVTLGAKSLVLREISKFSRQYASPRSIFATIDIRRECIDCITILIHPLYPRAIADNDDDHDRRTRHAASTCLDTSKCYVRRRYEQCTVSRTESRFSRRRSVILISLPPAPIRNSSLSNT